MERRLAAILGADLVGYSRMMTADEPGTHAAIKARRTEAVEPTLAEHGGRLFKLMGDRLLAGFASAVNALACAVAPRREIEARNAALSDARRLTLRCHDRNREGQDTMDLKAFKGSISSAAPPKELSLPLQALWWDAKGDWDKAHDCAQRIEEEKDGQWVHAYLHRKQGDPSNAGYWYRRCRRTPATVPLAEEWEMIARALLEKR